MGLCGYAKGDGCVDVKQCSLLVQHAYPYRSYIHRAFDRVTILSVHSEDVIASDASVSHFGLHPKASGD